MYRPRPRASLRAVPVDHRSHWVTDTPPFRSIEGPEPERRLGERGVEEPSRQSHGRGVESTSGYGTA